MSDERKTGSPGGDPTTVSGPGPVRGSLSAETGAGGLPGGLLERALRIPLFYKILLGNAAVLILGTVVSAALVARLLGGVELRTALQAIALGASLALILSVAVNAFLITLALAPLRGVEATARKVGGGAEHARAPMSLLADAELSQLTRVFNEMLDSLAESRHREQELAVRVLEAEERERHRISRELYDDPAQRLATALLSIQLAERNVGPDSGTHALLQGLRRDVVEALESIRTAARRLRPPELDEVGLMPALRALARRAAEESSMEVTVKPDVPPPLEPRTSLALYRVVQEALSNAVLHADAGRVSVSFDRQGDHFVTIVRDDGHGFDPAEVLAGPSGGLGLLAMKERASYVGGGVTFETAPERGTEVRITLPCRAVDSRNGGTLPAKETTTTHAG